MPNAIVDHFGRLLMTKVRDETISDWKMILDGRMKGERAEGIRRSLSTLSEEQLKDLVVIVSEVTDTVLHHLLRTLEQRNDVMVHVSTPEADVPDLKLISDGLAGELGSSNGWISRFSNERV